MLRINGLILDRKCSQMKTVSKKHVLTKIRAANPWWNASDLDLADAVPFSGLRVRPYFHLFRPLATARSPTRALLLMGPRRVGKTVLVFHLIRWLLNNDVSPKQIVYLDLQQPLYGGLPLEVLLSHAIEARGMPEGRGMYVFFDEVQYLRKWEVHLKSLVDSYPHIKFIATGSAAAALRLKSNESGAGRFTDFLLPPLTFFEYLDLIDERKLIHVSRRKRRNCVSTVDIDKVNAHFIDYLNCGGYPEAVFSDEIKSDMGRYIRADIIDKVLLKDLPSLYGIQDIQELNSLFTTLAYNTAHEVSLNELSQNSGVAKNTIKRYIEYLQSAFLLRVVHRVDRTAKRFQRATHFKVYLTNPSMRSALFSPIAADDEDMGDVVETAVFAQWFHSLTSELFYARWSGGEVDIVYLDPRHKPTWLIEVKWSDRFEKRPSELTSLIAFCDRHPECTASVTTRTKQSSKAVDGHDVRFIPAALYCYVLGYNIINGMQKVYEVTVHRGPQLHGPD